MVVRLRPEGAGELALGREAGPGGEVAALDRLRQGRRELLVEGVAAGGPVTDDREQALGVPAT